MIKCKGDNMDLNRNTYAEINIKNIKNNVEKIIQHYNDYTYYIGVIKADCYGHDGLETVKAIIDGGCNYLAVATLDEALIVRKTFKNIPILCLGPVPSKHIDLCISNNITITINSLEYLKELDKYDLSNIKVHIKLNTGMNRLGISSIDELKTVISILNNKKVFIEGIYTHLYNADNKDIYEKQLNIFKELIDSIDIDNIKIIHMSASDGIVNYSKPKFINGCRLGIIMYGFTKNKDLKLQSTFSLYSEIIQINTLNNGDTVGYNGIYRGQEGDKIAIIPIGYADGIIRKNTGRYVYINDKKYTIVGNICMDMLFVKIDDSVHLHDKVVLLKDITHIEEVARHLDTIPYEVMCMIGKRVKREYI